MRGRATAIPPDMGRKANTSLERMMPLTIVPSHSWADEPVICLDMTSKSNKVINPSRLICKIIFGFMAVPPFWY